MELYRNNRNESDTGILSVTGSKEPFLKENLKSNDTLEIEYITFEKKQTLKVYVDDLNYCVDSSAAYELGLINVEEFSNSNSDYYYTLQETIDSLKEKYSIEYHSLNLEQNLSNKAL